MQNAADAPAASRDAALDVAAVRRDTLGDLSPFTTPFGVRPLVYADHTASGRALGRIEAFVTDRVLPGYANTHSESSWTGARTTGFVNAARETIRSAVHARPDDHVIFCGSGATGAIHKWIDLLGLRALGGERTHLFIGPYEHHSNDLPWRELPCTLHVVPLDADGALDVAALEAALATVPDGAPVVGSFSGASNVTGRLTDVERVTAAIHARGGVCGWDYAAAAPYVPMDMSAGGGLDALFFSPHKFLGGPGAPGVLVVDGRPFTEAAPTRPGGGTVSFVSRERQRYLADLTRREEAGTPDILGAIRAGLAMRVKADVGEQWIAERDHALARLGVERLAAHPRIRLLGSASAPRLPIFAVQVHDADGEVPYGLVVALLNDLFGIQARGGCSCAGRYGHDLLGIDETESRAIEDRAQREGPARRPGWVRFGLHWSLEDDTVDYLLAAIEFVAEHARTLEAHYRLDAAGGVWRHRDAPAAPAASLDPGYGAPGADAAPAPFPASDLGAFLDEAERIVASVRGTAVA
jgi:selenocysteine lyase/cysteine desulfurase